MSFNNVTAYGVQLAELFARVLKLDGRIETPSMDFRELTATAQSVVAASARVNDPVVLDAALKNGHAQRLWIATDDAGVNLIMCPQKPGSTEIKNLVATIGRKVEVENSS